MRVADVDVRATPQGTELTASVVWERSDEVDRLRFVYRGTPADAITTPGDAVTAAVVVPAMVKGEDVSVDAPVSPTLLAGISTIVDVMHSWEPRWRRSTVDAPAREPVRPAPTTVASCFSGGLDGFFTVLRPRSAEITTLVTMLGFTMTPASLPKLERLMPVLSRAAERLGKEHIVVDTNVYLFGAKHVPRTAVRGAMHHGSALAAMVLGLGSRFRRCYIGSSWAHRVQRPWGSHPFTDPLWSTDTLEFVHDGAEFIRAEKLPQIADNEVMLDTLRVCGNRHAYPDNCRSCDKCQATGLMLLLAGTLERSRTLGPVTPATIRRTAIGPSYVHIFEALRARAGDPEIARAIDVAVARAKRRRRLRPLGDLLRRLHLR